MRTIGRTYPKEDGKAPSSPAKTTKASTKTTKRKAVKSTETKEA